MEVCYSPVIAVCDTGASVSCISYNLLQRLPSNFQRPLQQAHRRLLAANQAEIPVMGTVTLPISLASTRFLQQFFVLKSSDADCLLGLDFLEDNECDALFSSMQLRFPNSKTVPLFHNHNASSQPSTDSVRVIAVETTFIPAGHEAVILGELSSQRFTEKSEGIFEPSSAFCEKHQVLSFSSLCESEELIPARLICPVTDVTVHKGTTLGTYSVVDSEDVAAINRVITNLPETPHGSIPDKYDINELLKQSELSLDPKTQAEFAQLLRSYSDVFSKTEWDIGRCDLVQHRIDLYPGSKPVKLPNRRMPMHFKADLRQKIDKFLEHKLITPCHSPYSSPAMLVPKKNGKLRLVIDYQQLNKQTVKSCWPLPSTEEIFDTLEGSGVFSTIDMSWGFYQLPLEQSSQDYTAFSTPFGSFKWLVMPMGLTGSPPVFQSLMEKVLIGLTWKSTIPYLDDCIIFSRTYEEHVVRLKEVFQRFKDANLKINPLKCEFFRSHVPFLGHVVSRDGVQVDPAKTSAVRQYPIPKSVTETKSFLGLCSYYRRYVRNFAAIARPLHQLTEKKHDFLWTPEAQQAFDQLKDCLTSSPILAFPSMKEPFILYTDASQYAMGAVLAQVQNDHERVICYASNALNKAQSRYSTTKRELLAIVTYTKHFKHYLLGRRFKIITDHRALQWLHNFKDPDALTARWLEKLAAFDYDIEHRSGKSIGHADCMSRLPSQTAAINMTTTFVSNIGTVTGGDSTGASYSSQNQQVPAPPSVSTSVDDDRARTSVNDEDTTDTGHEPPTVPTTSGNFTLTEKKGNLLDFPHSIVHCISADFKLAAGIAAQIREKFPTVYPRNLSRQQCLYAQAVGDNTFVYHLIVKPRYFHKPSYRSLKKSLSALRDHVITHQITHLGISQLSCGLDSLAWPAVRKIIEDTFLNTNVDITAYTLPNPLVAPSPATSLSQPLTLQAAQSTDSGLKVVLSWVRDNSRPPRAQLQGFGRHIWKLWNMFDELTIQQDILCRTIHEPHTNTKLLQQVVPPSLVPEILRSLHSTATCAHLGVRKTLEKVRARFYWPGHKRDVQLFVASCITCQKRNSPSRKLIHSLRTWRPSFPFSTVGLDFLGPLPLSSGNQYILLIGDHFTKWHEAVALPDQSASTTAKALVDHWITRFGCPDNIHSDQGRNFEAKLFTSLMQLLQIHKTRTTAFRPQSNAVIERTNRTLLNMLAKTVDKNQGNWSDLLPYVMFAYRTSVHESTGYTPYFLLFGHEVTLPVDLQFPPPENLSWPDYHEFVAATRLKFQTAYEEAREHMNGQQKRQHALYNTKAHGPTYNSGQLIFLHCPAPPRGLSPKLHSFWRGPYRIEQVISELTYKIKELETGKELVVHYDRLKPCRVPPEKLTCPTFPSSSPTSMPSATNVGTPIPPNCHPCACDAGPILVSGNATAAPSASPLHSSPGTASRSFDIDLGTQSAPPADDTFPNRSPGHDAPTSVNCSFNTAASSPSVTGPSANRPVTPPPPQQPVGPFLTSTPRKATAPSFLSPDVLSRASARLHTLSPTRPFYQDCPRVLRPSTVNQRHATTQHVLNKQLPADIRLETGITSSSDVSSSGVTTEFIPSSVRPCNRSIRPKTSARKLRKPSGTKSSRK